MQEEILRKLNRILELLGDKCDDEEPPEPPAPEPEPVEPLTWQQVAGDFAKRYQAARGINWHYGAHVQALTDITAQLNAQQGDVIENGRRLMDNFFADEYAKNVDYAPGLLAKQFGRYFRPLGEDEAAEAEERQRKALEAQRRHEAAKARAEAEHARKVAARGGDDTALEELRAWLKGSGG